MQTSEQVNELAKALAAAQGEMKNPAFDSKNPHFASKYVSLAGLRDAIVPVLSKHGVALVQEVRGSTSGVECSTRLIHTSGQWIELGPFFAPVSRQTAQDFGSASTYARRFSLSAVVALVGDDDDDGNKASAGGADAAGKASARAVDEFPPKDGPIGRPVATTPPAASEKVEHEGWVNPLMQAVAAKESKAFLANILAAMGWKKGVSNGGLSEDGLLKLKEQLEAVKEAKK